MDQLIRYVDNGLRTVFNNPKEKLDIDEFPNSAALLEQEKQRSIALMRVNHCGEVCAQALYDGQALTTRATDLKEHLQSAAAEERRHLQMCQSRLDELEGRTSVLDPLFYGMSFSLGAIAGWLSPQVGMGFVGATEDEVCKHLDRHLDELSPNDQRTRAMLESIRSDEAQHQQSATELGGTVFSKPLKSAMALVANVMTKTTRVI